MILDIIVLVIVGLGFLSGYRRGIINTLFDTLSIVIAVVAALKLSPIVIGLIRDNSSMHSGVSFILGFLITFFVVVMLIRFVGKQLEKLLESVNLDPINKLAGGALMGFIFMIILGGVIALSNALKIIPTQTKQESMTYETMVAVPNYSKSLFLKLKPAFQSFWDETNDAIDDMSKLGKDATESGK